MLYNIPLLPLKSDVETKMVLKKALLANKKLAELKGIAKTIPNEAILINTLAIQESKDSSAVEQIVTTHDELFQYDERHAKDFSLATKEVQNYCRALQAGFEELKKNDLITSNLLIKLVKILTERDKGFRDTPGTTLKNPLGEIIYTPPQEFSEIRRLMDNLEKFINDQTLSDYDPLVKMAIIHHQFESIHPFYDGNGRTGRILNILYLILMDVLELPILYLSRFIIQNKSDYYRLLQSVREEDTWVEWIFFMLQALENTAEETIVTIKEIKKLMQEYKTVIKKESPHLYSHELLNTIFSHPYTKIEFIVRATGITRQTASKHLQELVSLDLLTMQKIKNTNYYINSRLLNILTRI